MMANAEARREAACGKVDAEICRDKAGRVNSSWIPNDCAEAIKKESEQ